MRSLIGWVSDPYVHIAIICVVLLRLAMAAGGDDLAGSPPLVGSCPACFRIHQPGTACVPPVKQVPTGFALR